MYNLYHPANSNIRNTVVTRRTVVTGESENPAHEVLIQQSILLLALSSFSETLVNHKYPSLCIMGTYG